MTEAATILDTITPPQAAPAVSPQVDTKATNVSPNVDKVPEPPQTPKEDDRVSSRLAVLMKREQAALARERAAKEGEDKLGELRQKLDLFESLKNDPKKALEALGMSYDQLTQSMLQDGQIPPEVQIKRVEDKLDAFKTEQQKQEDKRQEDLKLHAKAQEERATKEFKGEIHSYVKENAGRYELTQFEDQQDLVYGVIEEHYNRTIDTETGVGKVMTIAEACDKVEQFLEQKELKRKELSKVKTLWGIAPKGFKEAIKQELPKQVEVSRPKTLTNQLSATQTPKKSHFLTDQELKNRAIEYAKALMAKRQL